MFDAESLEYLARREARQQTLADAAAAPAIAAIHRELADHYRARIDQVRATAPA